MTGHHRSGRLKPGILFSLFGLSALCACQGSDQAEEGKVPGKEVAQKLDQAAEQSGPASREVLRDAAAEARARPSLAPVDRPGSFAQEALERAGKAEASAASVSPPDAD